MKIFILLLVLFGISGSKGKWIASKGGFLSEKSGGFLLLQTLQKHTPFYYPKLLHPVHGIDKIIIEFNTFKVKKPLWL